MKTTYFIKTLLLTCCLIPAIMLAENVSVTQLKTEQLSNPTGLTHYKFPDLLKSIYL